MAAGHRQVTYGAENLKALRDAAGMSRRQLVEALNEQGVPVHATTLRRLEEGEQQMKVDEAAAIAGYFQITMEELLLKPIDTIGADIVPLTREVGVTRLQALHDMHLAIDAYETLRLRLAMADIPPAVRSQAVKDAQAELERVRPFIDRLRTALNTDEEIPADVLEDQAERARRGER